MDLSNKDRQKTTVDELVDQFSCKESKDLGDLVLFHILIYYTNNYRLTEVNEWWDG
jgi:hypothetical protein